jgi:REP element-mobilizing transposase RayT
LPQRKPLPHGRPFSAEAVYFITVCAAHRSVNTLAFPEVAPALWREWCRYGERGACYPILFVVMPDHVHGLFRFPVDREMVQVVSAWKRLTSRRHGVAWQRDFFDHRLRREESFEEKAAYIRLNPQRAGLVTDAAAWPYVWTNAR